MRKEHPKYIVVDESNSHLVNDPDYEVSNVKVFDKDSSGNVREHSEIRVKRIPTHDEQNFKKLHERLGNPVFVAVASLATLIPHAGDIYESLSGAKDERANQVISENFERIMKGESVDATIIDTAAGTLNLKDLRDAFGTDKDALLIPSGMDILNTTLNSEGGDATKAALITLAANEDNFKLTSDELKQFGQYEANLNNAHDTEEYAAETHMKVMSLLKDKLSSGDTIVVPDLNRDGRT